jgi:nanoRNase/pAp phosphatase (c-di-AMP/oligoRNAs hydrolase)
MQNDLQNFSTILQQWRTIVVVIKGSPDPDALAAAYAVRLFAETLGVQVRIIAPERLSLPQNKTFVRLLGIPLKLHADPAKWRRKADAYGVVDHQSAVVPGLEDMPCAFQLDHHQPLGDEDGILPAFRLVEQTAGATCTILARLFSGLRTPLEPERMRRIATALLFGS